MKYPLVNKLQRSLSFLIDYAIVCAVSIPASYFITKGTGLLNSYNEAQTAFSQAESQGVSEIGKLMLAKLPLSGVYAGVFLAVMILYFVILPLCSSWQTIGRLVMKCRLRVCKTNEKPSFKHLFIREIVCNYIIYVLLTVFLMGWNLILWISIFYGLFVNCSFGDRFSRTKMTDLREKKAMEFSDLGFEHVPDKDWEKMDAMEAEILASTDKEEGDEN